ncbi:MAG: ATP-dependent Clp protease adaptor ClpS [Spirochaetales bacterium]
MEQESNNSTDTQSLCNEKLKEPSQYKVILLNDDYTTKDFVIDVLMQVFHKTAQEAALLTEKVHVGGHAPVGTYTYDIAATKVAVTMQLARQQEFPLQCKLEEC